MRQGLIFAALGLMILAVRCGGGSGMETDVAEQSTSASPAADGWACSAGLRVSVINDYAAAPDPDGAEPEAAVQAYFRDDLPEGATLTANGAEVTVMVDEETMAVVDVLEVPGGYVVGTYVACPGAVRGP